MPRGLSTKVKNAQEPTRRSARRAIRSPCPNRCAIRSAADEFRLYDLIWKRTVASQMADARGRSISITIEGAEASFQVGGKTIDFPGYLRAYVEGADDPAAELADKETILPDVAVGEILVVPRAGAERAQHATAGRYNEATLTKALEELGIGRPEHVCRDHRNDSGSRVRREARQCAGADLGGVFRFATARRASAGPRGLSLHRADGRRSGRDQPRRADQLDYLKNFYFGNGQTGLKKQLENKVDEIDARDVSRILLGQPEGGEQFSFASAVTVRSSSRESAGPAFPSDFRPTN